MKKSFLYSKDAKDKLLSGAWKLCNAVQVTLGPKGRNAVYFDQYGKPQITKDGIAVASQVTNLEDDFEELGACVIRQASSKTADEAGDGTTTTTILATDMVDMGLSYIKNQALNPIDLKAKMEHTRDAILNKLDELAQPCNTYEQIKQVATISANNDEVLGELIAEAISQAGNDGVVTIEDSPNEKTYLESSEGMQFDRGYLSKYFANRKNKCILDNPLILVTDKKITNLTEIAQILGDTAEKGKSLLIVAPDYEDQVIAGVATANKAGQIKACCIKAPGMGDLRKELLLDLCASVNAELITEDLSLEVSKATIDQLGTAKQVIVTKNTCTIVEGQFNSDQIDERVDLIQNDLQSPELSEYQKEKLNERLAKLTGGIVVIRVGAITEVELIEKKARIEDALNATRAAIEDGIVPGGGVALAQISKELDGSHAENVIKACTSPLEQILDNAGLFDELYDKILDMPLGSGYNINTKESGDMIELGVIDPVKVTKQALINSISVASMLLTTEVAIGVKEEEKNVSE